MGHLMKRELGIILCDLDPKVKVKKCICFVSAYPPKPLNVVTSNFAGA